VRKIAKLVTLILATVVSFVAAVVLIAAVRDDVSISDHRGVAAATVLSVSFNRVVIQYATPDGTVHVPADGVRYFGGLKTGDEVLIEYDTTNTDLTKVYGRKWTLALPPSLSTIAITILVAGLILWALRGKSTLPPRQQDVSVLGASH
jgi:hypothetical protein